MDFNQVFGVIRDNAASGANSTSQVADFLIGAGLSVAAITQLLNGVATSANAAPYEIAYAQDVMRQVQLYQQPRQNYWPLIVLAGLVYIAAKED